MADGYLVVNKQGASGGSALFVNCLFSLLGLTMFIWEQNYVSGNSNYNQVSLWCLKRAL